MLVKLDFSNAFNSVRRDAMREAVALHAPSLLGYIDSPSGAATTLRLGEHVIESVEGIQQVDPLGSTASSRSIAEVTGDPRSKAFLKQRLAQAVQCKNAASV